MPFVTTDLFSTIPYSWTALLDDTIYSNTITYNNPPHEVGLCSLYLVVTAAAGTNQITITFQYYLDGTLWSTAHDIDNDSSVNTLDTSTTAAAFESRLDNQNWWKYGLGFRIILERRDAGEAQTINFAKVVWT